jgi:hypothetical protein
MATPDITGAEQRINEQIASMAAQVKSWRERGEKTEAEISGSINKMAADITKLDTAVSEMKAAALAAPVIVQGDVRRRFAAGGVVRAFGTVDVVRVAGKDVKVAREGFFTCPETLNAEHAVAKAAYELAVIRAVQAGQVRFTSDSDGNTVVSRAHLLRAMAETSPDLVARMSFSAHAAGLTDSPDFVVEKVFGVSSSNGSDFIPAEVLLPDMTRIGGAAYTATLVSLFKQQTINVRNPYLMVTTALPRPYAKGSATASAVSEFVLSGPTTGKRPLDVKGFAVGVRVDRDFEDDSLLSSMIEVRTDMARAMALGAEDSIINGDNATPHQDTALASWNPEGVFTAGGSSAGGPLDHRRQWRGLRAAAFDISNTVNVGGDPTFATIQTMQASFTGARGMNAARTPIITDFATIVGKLSTITEVKTIDVYGPNATIMTGEVARIGGKPILRSPFMGRQGANTGSFTSAGLYTTGGTFNKAAMIMVDLDAWTVATRKGITIEAASELGTDTSLVIATHRMAFMTPDHVDPVSSTSIHNVCYAYGINV